MTLKISLKMSKLRLFRVLLQIFCIDRRKHLFERERISSDSLESYQDLLGKIHILCGKLAVNALKNATKNGLESVNQNKLQLQKNENQSIETKAPITFKLAPENIKYSVKMKLARPKNSN